MGVRDRIAAFGMSTAISLGRMLGCEPVVEAGNSIEITMEVPNKTDRAWDPELYSRGQLYLPGYANPVKPIPRHNKEVQTKDTVELEEGGEETEDDVHAELMTSWKYKEYMNQHLISDLVNPSEQWRLIIYGIIALGGLSFISIIVTLWSTGTFA